jgi:GNAT superfamily N-acetyltransferase
MSRTTVPLRVDHLARLPEPERSCLFWQLGPVDRARLGRDELAAEKETWTSSVLREWGSCGRVAMVDGEQVGYAVYAPAAWLPGAHTLPTSPCSPDAVVLATVWVDPAWRRGGIGRLLVQGVARDLVQRGHGALEAYGGVSGRTPGCLLPLEFLGGVGFKTQRAHSSTPRMRMDLRSAISWKDEVEQALERLWGVVRPAKTKATRPIGSVRAASCSRSGDVRAAGQALR